MISVYLKSTLEGLNEQYSAAFNAVNKDVKTKLDSAEKKIGLGIEKAELLLATVSDTSRAQGTEVESLISTLYEDLPRFKAEMESIRSAIISARESQMEELKLVLKTAEDVLGMRSNLTVLSIHVAELPAKRNEWYHYRHNIWSSGMSRNSCRPFRMDRVSRVKSI